MRSPGAWFVGAAAAAFAFNADAAPRFTVQPSVTVAAVHEDNLFFSDQRPANDFIQRLTPELRLRLDSPRWSAGAAVALDSERFSNHSSLDDSRARERASLDFQYLPTPRLTLSLDGSYLDTNTLAELNTGTGLAAARGRATMSSVRPSASYRLSPRLLLRASSLINRADVRDGIGSRMRIHNLTVERSLNARDVFTGSIEHAGYEFDGETQPVASYALLAGWTRQIGPRTRLALQGGPRRTGGTNALEASARLTHVWRASAIELSAMQTQTTVAGLAGVMETQMLQSRLHWTPSRALVAFAGPGVFRTSRRSARATVYRIEAGATYTLTPSAGLEVMYRIDSQRSSIEPLRVTGGFSHSVLSVAFTTRRGPSS